MYTINGKQYGLKDAIKKMEDYLDYFIEEMKESLSNYDKVLNIISPDKEDNNFIEQAMVGLMQEECKKVQEQERELQKKILSSDTIDLLVDDMNLSIEKYDEMKELNNMAVKEYVDLLEVFPATQKQYTSPLNYEMIKTTRESIKESIEMFKDQKDFLAKFKNIESYDEGEKE